MMYEENGKEIGKPAQLSGVLSFSKLFVEDFKFVRVYFYAEEEFLYLGDITVFQGNGAERLKPAVGHKKLGKLLQNG